MPTPFDRGTVRAYSARRRLELARGDARVVEYEAMLVVGELVLVVEPRRRVRVPLTLALVLEANVTLLQPLDAQRGRANVGSRRFGAPAELEPQAVHREGVGERGALEIDVEASRELHRWVAVDRPSADPIRLEHHLRHAR